MRLIPLTQGQFAQVDDADHASLSVYKWFAQFDPKNGNYYAARKLPRCGSKQLTLRMHRLLCPTALRVDHADGNSLNNQRYNLRPVTGSQNAQNARTKTGKYKGVHARAGKWRAGIRANNKQLWLGTFSSPKIAALAYDFSALRYFGEYARLNFPQSVAS
jgi:hypothetical protein